MISNNGWLAVLMAQLVIGLLAFLGGTLLVHGFRSRRRAAGALPGARGVVQAPPQDLPPAPAVLPIRECGDGLLFTHEMRNYLCAIRGNAHLLRQKAGAPDQAALLDRIDKAVERLEGFAWKDQTCPDVTASRIRERIDPELAARNCCRTQLEPGGAEFLFNSSEGLPYIQGDPHRLEQVFTNLYGNALEAGADKVKTTFRRIGNELEISVEDNGRGCRPESACRLFDPFFTTKSAAGSGGAQGPIRGLGLFIVRSIVENHGGRIRATSKNDRGFGETGLVVYLHFPLPGTREDRTPAPLEDRAAPSPERLPIASGA